MRNKKLLLTVIIAVALSAATALAMQPAGTQKCAFKGDKKHDKMMDKMRQELRKELNLTPEQDKKLAENHHRHMEEMGKLRSEMQEKRGQLQAALKDPGVSRAKIAPLVSELKELQGRLIEDRINGIFAVKEILSPEQFVKFQQMMGKHMKGKEGRFPGKARHDKKGMKEGCPMVQRGPGAGPDKDDLGPMDECE